MYCAEQILYELIPCREISDVKAFSRETLVALIANIETREWRLEHSARAGIPPEHPRASTTDDVECLFI